MLDHPIKALGLYTVRVMLHPEVVIGVAVLWATGVTLLGYFLGGIPFLQKNIEAALVAIVLVSVLPMAFEWWRHRRAGRSN